MLALLPNILSHSNEPIGTVLHIGAGVGSELETYRKLNCENVVAIEPDAALYKKLSAKAKRFNNVETIQSWIGDKSTKTEAQIFANPRFNSLLPAGTLLDHFENLKQPKVIKVSTLSLSEFLSSKRSLDQSKKNILVVEAQGFEVKLLQACETPLLQHFSVIVVRTSETSLYQDGANVEQLSTCLREKSFDLLLSDAGHSPSVEQYYQLNLSQLALAHAQKELKNHRQQSLEKIELLDGLVAEQTRNLTTLEANKADLQHNLVGKDQESTKLRSQLVQSNEKISTLQNDLHQVKSDKNALQAEYENIKQNLDSKQAKVDELSQTIQNMKGLKDKLEEKLSDTTKNFVLQQENANSIEQELATANKTLHENQGELADFKGQLSELETIKTQLEHNKSGKKALEEQVNSLSAEASENTNVVAKLEEQKQAAVNQIKAQLVLVNTKLANAEALIETTTVQKQELNEKFESLKVSSTDKLTALKQDHESKLTDIRKKLDDQTHWHNEQKIRAENFIQKNTELNESIQKLNTECNKLKHESEGFKSSIIKYEDSFEEIKEREKHQANTIEITSKLLSKMQTENEYLRKEYATKISSENELRQLIGELHQKLQMAANFYQQLEKEHPEIVLEHRDL
jgi:FkbM family methyltransferase